MNKYMKVATKATFLSFTLLLTGCGNGGLYSNDTQQPVDPKPVTPEPEPEPLPSTFELTVSPAENPSNKANLQLSWDTSVFNNFTDVKYDVCEKDNTQENNCALLASMNDDATFTLPMTALQAMQGTEYFILATVETTVDSIVESTIIPSNDAQLAQEDINALINVFKPSNSSSAIDDMGLNSTITFSADGTTLALGMPGEDSGSVGVDGQQSSMHSEDSGATYIFRFKNETWVQEAYIKASNAESKDNFGHSVALSGDGNTLVVGAPFESSSATGFNADETDNSAMNSGAVYLFHFDTVDANWSQKGYIKSSNSDSDDNFGHAVSLSEDGELLAVSARHEASSANTVNGDETDNSIPGAGAVYLFRLTEQGVHNQEAYIKASNPDYNDNFGQSISLSADGKTLVVGADGEDSNAVGIDGPSGDGTSSASGAAYIYRFETGRWDQQAYIKASNTEAKDAFGFSVALSADGNTLAVGANKEDSPALGVNGDQVNNTVTDAGAVYLFRFISDNWQQQAYIKASNTGADDTFGQSVALSADGNTLAVGAYKESSNEQGIIDTDQSNNMSPDSGAVYLFKFGVNESEDMTWAQSIYIKQSTGTQAAQFGFSISLSAEGALAAIAPMEASQNAEGINPLADIGTHSLSSGAVYLY